MSLTLTQRIALPIAALFIALPIPIGWAQDHAGPEPLPITATPFRASGIYAVGETVGWTLRAAPGSAIKQVRYTIKSGGLKEIAAGVLDLSSGRATVQTTLAGPNSVLVDLGLPSVSPEKSRTLLGALVAPAQIEPAMPRPADFDAWWASKIEQLQAVPPNPKLEPGESGDPAIELEYIVMDNVLGRRIYGQIAKPRKPGPYPAVLQLQWAGVYPLQKSWVVDKAKLGYLALDIEAHSMPGNLDPSAYKKAAETNLHDYWTIGNQNRETSYFLPMYLGDYRAVEYLTHRPDWNGRTLVLIGGSQGGQQSIVTAGLESGKVTAVSVIVPSSCDATGPRIGRAAAYPDWAAQAREHHDERIMETSRYFDPVNFASRITCPAQVAMGFLDETSPPAGVWAMLNQIKAPVEAIPMIHSPHQDQPVGVQKIYQDRSLVWLETIAAGQPPPVDASLAKP